MISQSAFPISESDLLLLVKASQTLIAAIRTLPPSVLNRAQNQLSAAGFDWTDPTQAMALQQAISNAMAVLPS